MQALYAFIGILAWQVLSIAAQVPDPCDLPNGDYPPIDSWLDDEWYVVEWTGEETFRELLVGDTSSEYPVLCPRFNSMNLSSDSSISVTGYFNDPDVQAELTTSFEVEQKNNVLSGVFQSREGNDQMSVEMSLLATDQVHNFTVVGVCVTDDGGSVGNFWTLSRREREQDIDQDNLISALENLGLRRNMFVDTLMERCP